jgi:hypothetical protein
VNDLTTETVFWTIIFSVVLVAALAVLVWHYRSNR